MSGRFVGCIGDIALANKASKREAASAWEPATVNCGKKLGEIRYDQPWKIGVVLGNRWRPLPRFPTEPRHLRLELGVSHILCSVHGHHDRHWK
jgi:hypothetical protein